MKLTALSTVALLVALTTAATALPIQLDTTGTGPEQLPAPRHGTCAATDGHYGYIFGGQQSSGNSRAEVFRHDPAADTVTQASPNLPAARHMCSAVWYNGSAYIFAGYDFTNRNDIFRWTPGSTAVRTGSLVAAASHQTAVVDPATGMAYVIGGYANNTLLARIQMVDLRGGNSTPVVGVVAMPPRAGASAVWDPRPLPPGECLGGCVYIVSGHNGTAYTTSVLRYDPMTDKTTETSTQVLPGRLRHAAVFDGVIIHVYGGDTPTRINETLNIDPITGASWRSAPLPKVISHVSAAWIDDTAYVYGGSTDPGILLRDITWHKPLGAISETIEPDV